MDNNHIEIGDLNQAQALQQDDMKSITGGFEPVTMMKVGFEPVTMYKPLSSTGLIGISPVPTPNLNK